MKMIYRVIGGLVTAAGIAAIIVGGKPVCCDSPEVKEMVIAKVGGWLNLINNGVGNQPGMPQETLDLLAGGNALDILQGKQQRLSPSPDGKPYLITVSTTRNVENRHVCTARAVDSKGRAWPVNYTVDVSDDKKTFSVGIQQF
jgi:hypothetical protein